jgi:hypothetical protein
MFAFSPQRGYACRQRARIQTYIVIIAITLNTIRYSMFYLISSWALKSEAPVPVERCARHSWTRMTPAVAVAAGNSFGFAGWDLASQRVS